MDSLCPMPIASSFPFLEVFWTVLVFVALLVWLSLLFYVFVDLFGRDDMTGVRKVAWILLLVLIPYLGVFIYLVATTVVGEHPAGDSN
jgi:hypothetical protein